MDKREKKQTKNYTLQPPPPKDFDAWPHEGCAPPLQNSMRHASGSQRYTVLNMTQIRYITGGRRPIYHNCCLARLGRVGPTCRRGYIGQVGPTWSSDCGTNPLDRRWIAPADIFTGFFKTAPNLFAKRSVPHVYRMIRRSKPLPNH